MSVQHWAPIKSFDDEKHFHRRISLFEEKPKLNLPIFPKFKKLELSDKDTIENFVKDFPPYSDFNFTSLWSYNIKDEAEISALNDNLVVKYHDYVTGEPFYTFLGINKVNSTAEILLKKSLEEGWQPTLKLISECSIKAIENSNQNLSIAEDIDSYDYIYSIFHLIKVSGNKYRGKRNFINRFKRIHPEYKVIKLFLNNPEIQNEILKLFDKWVETKDIEIQEAKYELKAIKRFFEVSSINTMIIIGIYINKTLSAFSINEIVHDNFAILHFEKADSRYIGIYQFLKNISADELNKIGCLYYNCEQDLGLSSLRVSKRSWLPVHFLKKYFITYRK